MNKNLDGDGWCFPMNLKTNKFILYVEKKNVTRPPLLNSNVLSHHNKSHMNQKEMLKEKQEKRKITTNLLRRRKKDHHPDIDLV